jgi:hypothetical protein
MADDWFSQNAPKGTTGDWFVTNSPARTAGAYSGGPTLPEDLPQQVGHAALQFLPAAAATAGTMLAPEGMFPAMAAAALFGGAGSAAQQGIEKVTGMPEAPKSLSDFGSRVGTEAAMQGLGEGGGRIINAAFGRAFGRYLNPEQLYQSALKTSTAMPMDETKKIIRAGIQEHSPVNPENCHSYWE